MNTPTQLTLVHCTSLNRIEIATFIHSIQSAVKLLRQTNDGIANRVKSHNATMVCVVNGVVMFCVD